MAPYQPGCRCCSTLIMPFSLQQLNLLKAKQKALMEQIEKEKIQSNKSSSYKLLVEHAKLKQATSKVREDVVAFELVMGNTFFRKWKLFLGLHSAFITTTSVFLFVVTHLFSLSLSLSPVPDCCCPCQLSCPPVPPFFSLLP